MEFILISQQRDALNSINLNEIECLALLGRSNMASLLSSLQTHATQHKAKAPLRQLERLKGSPSEGYQGMQKQMVKLSDINVWTFREGPRWPYY